MSFAGIDLSVPFPGDHAMRALKINTNLAWVGLYLAEKDHDKGITKNRESWVGQFMKMKAMGWGVAPIYVGKQVSSIGKLAHGPQMGGRGVTDFEGANDGDVAVGLAAAEKLPEQTIIYFDLEKGAGAGGTLPRLSSGDLLLVRARQFRRHQGTGRRGQSRRHVERVDFRYQQASIRQRRQSVSNRPGARSQGVRLCQGDSLAIRAQAFRACADNQSTIGSRSQYLDSEGSGAPGAVTAPMIASAVCGHGLIQADLFVIRLKAGRALVTRSRSAGRLRRLRARLPSGRAARQHLDAGLRFVRTKLERGDALLTDAVGFQAGADVR